MRSMSSRSQLSALAAVATVAFALAGCGGDKATLSNFAGTWGGHGKTLKITRAGVARAWVYSGCCYLAYAMRLRLSHPDGTPRAATAMAIVTAVHIGDRSWFSKAYPAPHVGESMTTRLRDGVITLMETNYCGPGVNWPMRGCGA
jgi:hypothetical protein